MPKLEVPRIQHALPQLERCLSSAEPLGPHVLRQGLGRHPFPGPHRVEDHAPLRVNASAARMGPGEGKAAAIVGAAVVVTGLVVGGDGGTVLVVGGVGLGLFGLYIWQRGD